MVNTSQYPPEIYDALYTDETGEVIGLDEVQLLDPIPHERTSVLINLLTGDDLYLAYQCGLVLAAWGIEQGVRYLQHLVTIRIDKVIELEPHRIWGQDNVYDIIARAFSITLRFTDYNKEEVIISLSNILSLYGECFFESKLKYALIDSDVPQLLPSIKQAMQAALNHERYYQASQLLPVLAKYDKAYAFAQVETFKQLVAKDERIRYNLEEMQLAE